MARFNIRDVGTWEEMARSSGYSITRLCALAGCSQRQLQRYTHDVFGRTPLGLLRNLRLRSAPAKLKKHRLAKEVAFELGFKQSSHFSREFRRCYGLPPREFLKREDRLAARASEAHQAGKGAGLGPLATGEPSGGQRAAACRRLAQHPSDALRHCPAAGCPFRRGPHGKCPWLDSQT